MITVGPDTESAAQDRLASRIALAGSSLVILAIWILQHPYGGIDYNDSTLYTLLALARLNPQLLSDDVFLRFGSQDTYTVFSPLFAAAIKLLDLEPAAALLSLAGQILFFGCGWLLARRVMPARQAALAVGLLVALPSSYGVGSIFNYVESFLTSRQMSEALVLAAVSSTLARRPLMTAVCLLAAMLLHPIMALAGFVMLACLCVVLPRPRLALVLLAALLAASLVPILLIPRGVFAPFDATWLGLALDSTPYLLLSQWGPRDWCHLAVPVAVLAIGAIESPSSVARRLCRAALITAASSVIVMLIYCDLLHVVIFTQVQPWRWLWLVQVLAVVLLPVIAHDCWQNGLPGRTALILLLGAWALRDDPATLITALLAVASVAAASRLAHQRQARMIFLGACALLIVALAINLAAKFSYAEINDTDANRASPLEANWLRIWGGDGVLYSAVLVAWWTWSWRTGRQPHLWAAIALSSMAAIVAVLLTPLAWQSWTNFHYTRAAYTAFAPWRTAIPQHSQVIWPHNPVGAWYLLERPSYYSIHQVAGDIFSRAKAIEIHRRAASIANALATSRAAPPQHGPGIRTRAELPANADRLDARGLVLVCGDPQLAAVVSWNRIGPETLVPVVPNPGRPARRLHVYRCADLRKTGDSSASAPASS
jgi:hypothetical protein